MKILSVLVMVAAMVSVGCAIGNAYERASVGLESYRANVALVLAVR